jgi:hypothetical protein
MFISLLGPIVSGVNRFALFHAFAAPGPFEKIPAVKQDDGPGGRVAGLRAGSNHARMRPAEVVRAPRLSGDDWGVSIADLGVKNGREDTARNEA